MTKKKKHLPKAFTIDGDPPPTYWTPEMDKEIERREKEKRKTRKFKKERNLKFVDGKWYVDFTFKKKRIRAFGGYTKVQARTTLARLRLEKMDVKLGLKKPGRLEDVFFKKFADEFMKLHSKLHKRSWRRDESSLKHLKPFFKNKMLGEIGPELVENYKAKRKATLTKKKTHVTEATINREIALLKTIFAKAVEWGRIEKNPLDKVKKFKETNQDMRILSDEEAIRLIDSAFPHLKPILILALNTGMRRSEILSLRWDNVDFRKGLIFIRNSKSGDRGVPMNLMVFETLKELLQISEFVFYNPETESHILDVKKSFSTARRNAKVNGLRFHDLRHTAASRMVQAGVDLATVSKILGHSTIQMTMRYVHPTTETMRAAVEKLAEIYKQTRQKVDSPNEEVVIKRRVKRLNSDN